MMHRTFTAGLAAAAIGAVTAGSALAQAGASYEVACSQALAEQEGVEQTAVQVGPAEEVAGTMQVNLTLEDVDWVCTLDAAGAVTSLEHATN